MSDGPSEDDRKKIYDGLSPEQKKKQTYTEWVKDGYNNQYSKWMPWIEDKYLEWFGHDNKASYATKEQLDKTKVTGVSQVDNLQDGVNNLVSGQVGKDGLLAPAGNLVSKEGVNRAERGGKDDSGTYGGPAASYTDPVAEKAQGAGQGVVGGVKGAAGYVGGMFGGGKKE